MHRLLLALDLVGFGTALTAPPGLSRASMPSAVAVNGVPVRIIPPIPASGVVDPLPGPFDAIAMFPRIAAMDAMDDVIASMSPDDTGAALR
jgi:hypothetical protein